MVESRTKYRAALVLAAILVLVGVVGVSTGVRRAEATNGWFTGGLVNSTSYTCPGPIVPSQQILGIGTYAGYWTDLTAPPTPVPTGNNPRVGDVFYAKLNVTAVGAACQGFGIVPTVRLPAGVNIAIDANNPLQCYYSSDIAHVALAPVAAGECPQQMIQSFDGAGQTVYSIRAPQASVYYPAWPLACTPLTGKCGSFEFWVPLVSSKEYDGLLPGSAMVFPVHAVDGWNDPWVYPQVALRVGEGAVNHEGSVPL